MRRRLLDDRDLIASFLKRLGLATPHMRVATEIAIVDRFRKICIDLYEDKKAEHARAACKRLLLDEDQEFLKPFYEQMTRLPD